jgi:O-antigen/teichoic acid export membrane protein
MMGSPDHKVSANIGPNPENVRWAPPILRNGLYNIGGQVVRGAVGLLTIPLLIRFLGIREYGVWNLAYAVLAIMTISEAGMSVAATVFLSKDFAEAVPREASRTLTVILVSAAILATTMGGILWFAGPLIGRSLPALSGDDALNLGKGLQIAGCGVSVMIIQRTLVGIEQAFSAYATINILDLIQALVASIGLIIVAWLGGKTIALMKWQVATNSFLLVGHCCVVYRLLRGRGLVYDWSKKKARQVLSYSMATWVSALGSAAFGQCDRLIVGGVLGAIPLGVYSAITGITSKINSFSSAAVQPLVPLLSLDAPESFQSGIRLRHAIHLNAFIALEAGIFLFALPELVMRAMVPGATAPQEILALQIAAIIYAIYSTSAPGYYALFSFGKAGINAFLVILSAMASLVLIFVGAKYFGLLGAIAGNIGYFSTFLLTVVALKKMHIPLWRYISWIAFPFLGLIVCLVGATALQDRIWFKVAFVVLQAIAFTLWFLRDQRDQDYAKLSLGRASES